VVNQLKRDEQGEIVFVVLRYQDLKQSQWRQNVNQMKNTYREEKYV
jgi:hypothetical protein